MFGADLLPYVLPIHDAPNFRDQRGAVEPKYDKASPEENLKDYKIYHMNLCQLHLEDEVDDGLDSAASLEPVILGLMYHPRFPSIFFNYIANQVPGMRTLEPEEVESFLEGNYGQNLQEVDCDYLSLILQLWSGRYAVTQYSNLKKALAWIENKRAKFVAYRTVSADLPATAITNALFDSPQLTEPKTIEFLPDKLTDSLPLQLSREGLMKLTLDESSLLREVFSGLGLLDVNDKFYNGVKPGAIAGIIRYLIKNKGFNTNCALIFIGLQSEFGYKGSMSSIQHYKEMGESNIKFFYKTETYYAALKPKG